MIALGKPGRLVKIDETTVQFQFDVPYFLFLDMMAGDTLIGGGQSVQQSIGNYGGAYSPAHYLKQFLPKYSSEANVNRMAKEQGFENWGRMLLFKKDWELNPEVPTLGPWHTVKPINTPTWTMERNPYYYAVDTAGNQLPYIDNVVLTLAESLEVVNLRAMAGEYDMQERHIDLQKLPIILDNRERGNYDVHLDLAYNGADNAIQINHSYTADAEVAKWLHNADFRRALALGIDRDQLNETFWLGLGTPGSAVPAEVMPQNPGPEWRKRWSTYDPDPGQQDAGRARADQEGRRGLSAAHRQRPAPGAADRGGGRHDGLSEADGNGGPAVAQDRHLRRRQADGARPCLPAADRQPGPDQRLDQRRHGADLPVPAPLPAGRSHGGPSAAWKSPSGMLPTARRARSRRTRRLKRALELFRSAASQQEDGRNKTAQEIWKIIVEQQFSIGTVGVSPAQFGVRIVSRRLGNIPSRTCIAQHCRTPGVSHPETWYFKA